MNTNTLKLAGIALAVFGSLSFAGAAEGETATDEVVEQGRRGKPEVRRERVEGEQTERQGTRGERGQRPSREEMIKKFDADGDGELSDAERATARAEMEKRRGEQKAEKPTREEIIKKYDADGNGELSEAERATMRKEMGERGRRGSRNRGDRMKQVDTDGDGQISEEERAAAREAMEKRRAEREAQQQTSE